MTRLRLLYDVDGVPHKITGHQLFLIFYGTLNKWVISALCVSYCFNRPSDIMTGEDPRISTQFSNWVVSRRREMMDLLEARAEVDRSAQILILRYPEYHLKIYEGHSAPSFRRSVMLRQDLRDTYRRSEYVPSVHERLGKFCHLAMPFTSNMPFFYVKYATQAPRKSSGDEEQETLKDFAWSIISCQSQSRDRQQYQYI